MPHSPTLNSSPEKPSNPRLGRCYELAGEFSTFYVADKVLVDDAAVRARRLLLCARTLLILETSLRLLGLRPLSRM